MNTARQIEVPEDVTKVVFQGSEVLAEVAQAYQAYQVVVNKANGVLNLKQEATAAIALGLARLNGVEGPVRMTVTGSGHLVVQEASNIDQDQGGGATSYHPGNYPTIQVLRERAAVLGVKIDDLPPQAKQKILARLEEVAATKK